MLRICFWFGPPTPSSKSRTNGHLALARCRPNQKQIRNIHAGQHEHEPDKQKEKRSHGLDHGRILRGGVKRTTRKGLEPIPLVDFRILGGEPTSHDGKYRLPCPTFMPGFSRPRISMFPTLLFVRKSLGLSKVAVAIPTGK